MNVDANSFGPMMEMRLGKLQQIELGGQLGQGKLIQKQIESNR